MSVFILHLVLVAVKELKLSDDRSETIVCHILVSQSRCPMAKEHKEALFRVTFVPLPDCVFPVVDPRDVGTLHGVLLYLSMWWLLSQLMLSTLLS